jgi:polyhydroxyalkanoate synthesis regulator phasin
VRFAKKGDFMAFTKGIGLVAAGFVLGTVGVKMATSEQAKKLCVQAVSKGLLVKAAGQDIIEQAKSNVDDIIAEANYLNQQETEAAAAATEPAAPPAKRGRQKK